MSRGETINTESVAQDQIRAFVERVMRMREEARAINDDIREIYAEAKGNGFDKTVLGKIVLYVEKRGKDANAVAEKDALFDLYLEAFDDRHSRTHAHEGNNSPAKVSTGNAVNPTPSGVLGAEDRKHPKHDGSGEASRLSDGSGPVAPNSATTGGPADGAEPDLAPVSSATQSTAAGMDRSNQKADGQGALNAAGSGTQAPAVDTTVTPFVAKPRRPLCRRPEMCGGHGQRHCSFDGLSCLHAPVLDVQAGGIAIEHQGAVG